MEDVVQVVQRPVVVDQSRLDKLFHVLYLRQNYGFVNYNRHEVTEHVRYSKGEYVSDSRMVR